MIVYPYKDNIYLNITNKCSMSCSYCIRYKWDWQYRGHDLKLAKDPSFPEVISEFEKFISAYKPGQVINEVVFCGYGEPLMRFEVFKKTAAYLKSKNFTVRLNTNGHGNLINKKNICPELKKLVDAVCISLNGETRETYLKLNKPRYGIKSFDAVIDFAKKCKKYVKNVCLTSLAIEDIDIKACRKIAKKAGVKFAVRPYLD
ncbi:MAG: hypothetical protein A2252_10645 [Elusimicrobia bacterium RIFOXYA2_FULL_39_19]|nr:MAG: hypothetical protein A2252_10645 [Elusimicrobia bacterium RIFOXYA2_FULL_39_19]